MAELLDDAQVFGGGQLLTDKDLFGEPKPKVGNVRLGGSDFGFGISTVRDAAEYERAQEKARQERYARLDSLVGGDFAPGGLDDMGLRFDIARSDRLSEMQRKFKAAYPTGSLTLVPLGNGESATVFRRTPKEPWREMNAPGVSRGDVAGVAGGVFSEPVAASVAAGARYGVVGAAIGAAVGVAARSGIESVRGFEDTPGREIAKQAGLEALVVGGVGTAVAGGLTAYRIASRGGFAQVRLGGEMTAGAQALGLPELMVGQLAQSPLLRGTFMQTAMTSPVVGLEVTAQERALLASMQGRVTTKGLAGLTDDALDQLTALQQKQLGMIYKFTAAGETQAGTALREGVESWKTASNAVIDRAYEAARKAEPNTVFFDLSGTQQLAKEIKQGTRAATLRAEQDARADNVANTVYELVARLVSREPPKPGTLRAEGVVPAEIKGVVDDLLRLDPTVRWLPDGTGAFAQMKALRTRLGDMTASDDPAIRAAAKRLYGALSESMNAPMGADSVQFLAAYKRAGALYEQHQQIASMNRIVASMNERGFAEDLATRFGPGDSDKLLLLKNILPPDNFRVVQESFKNSMFTIGSQSGGAAIIRRLDGFANDQAALRFLVTPQEEQALRSYAQLLVKFDEGVVRKAVQADITLGERALKITEGTAADMERTIRISGGLDSPFARSARAGLYQRLLDGATETQRITGEQILNPRTLLAAIDAAEKNATYKAFMRPEDWQTIRNYKLYSAAVAGTPDVGAGMQAGAVRAGVVNVINPARFLGAWRTVLQNALTAKVLSSPAQVNLIDDAAFSVGKIAGVTAALTAVLLETKSRQPTQAAAGRPLGR